MPACGQRGPVAAPEGQLPIAGGDDVADALLLAILNNVGQVLVDGSGHLPVAVGVLQGQGQAPFMSPPMILMAGCRRWAAFPHGAHQRHFGRNAADEHVARHLAQRPAGGASSSQAMISGMAVSSVVGGSQSIWLHHSVMSACEASKGMSEAT